MKILILSEGKHDGSFFKKLFPEIWIEDSQTRIIDLKTDSKLRETKNSETEEIRKFLGNYNPYKILAKSEGGKGKAIAVFSYIVSSLQPLLKEIDKTILMLDLDGITPEEQLNHLKQRIHTKYTTKIGIEKVDAKEIRFPNSKKPNLFILKNELRIEKNLFPFYLVLFTYSLEIESSIKDNKDDDKDSNEIIENKISAFVKNEDIRKIFSNLFKF